MELKKLKLIIRRVLNWLFEMSHKVDVIASVCTGAFLLAKSGVIDKHNVTTHWMDIEKLQSDFPNLQVKKNVRFIDEGKVMTSAGISAGIELSLHIVERFADKEVSKNITQRMEYHYGNSNVT